jgi:hypothetical protein
MPEIYFLSETAVDKQRSLKQELVHTDAAIRPCESRVESFYFGCTHSLNQVLSHERSELLLTQTHFPFITPPPSLWYLQQNNLVVQTNYALHHPHYPGSHGTSHANGHHPHHHVTTWTDRKCYQQRAPNMPRTLWSQLEMRTPTPTLDSFLEARGVH